MTAGQQASGAIAAAGGKAFAIGVAVGGYNGYSPGQQGSLVPLDYKGSAITLLASTPGGYDLAIAMNGFQPQNFFTQITIQDSAGVFRIYTSASASWSQQSGQTLWTWGLGASAVWNGAASRSMIINPPA